MARLDGKVAVITGGASGIGAAAVRLFIQEGARVIIADMQEDKGLQLAEELDDNAVFIRTDVSQAEAVKAAVDLAVSQFGRLDALFNNAGIPGPGDAIADIDPDAWDQSQAVLLRGVFLGIKYAAPVMMKQRTGSIINTASVAGIGGGYAGHAYSAAKAGVMGLTRSTALELGAYNVRVNAICPGGIATPIFGVSLGMERAGADQTTESIKQVLAASQVIPRAGLPDDIAQAALWLASDDSTFVSGHSLVVDGGATVGIPWSRMQRFAAVIGQAMSGD
jgi:NAD(P)-dependent dehydrogenase (short-subunit alcohol dehydrogenase family)